MSKRLIFFFFASQFLLTGQVKSNSPIIFSSISSEEQLKIKDLFKEFFKISEFAYSLYGDKPMSFSETLFNDHSPQKLLEFISLKDLCEDTLTLQNFVEPSKIFNERWRAWKKYKDQYILKKYLLIEKKIGDQIRVFFINIPAFKKIVNEHIHLFKKIINPTISAEGLIVQFEDESTNVSDILHHNVGLLGILLGFGKHNAMLFQKREDLTDLLERRKKSRIYKLQFIENKLNFINDKMKSFHEHDSNVLASINRVMFVADPDHPETIQLREKYDELNKKINEIYFKDDWFEQTLIQLTSD
jgi:hypothetical protein